MNLELFAPEACDNILPCDGSVQDYGLILDVDQAEAYFQYFLQHLAWQHDEVILHGQYFKTDRKVVWYGDEHYQYHYSGMAKQAHIWHPYLLKLKYQVEQITGHQFNSCLANLYENGHQAVGWHSDDEPSLISPKSETLIASLSLGATRKFRFKHKYKDSKADLLLHSGQLIVMRGQTQQYWKHAIAKSTKIIEPRINLTFRYFYPASE
ncbi:alpha-ketoglutarate-dependent dioxygenase AlkB family protein [Acinetobacter shaoyimingii]|uniref:Alpha-ketoglutarate-dependent dioxygenase AlkB n=1 Tax=Acinetobacter shaoyimingii TaxID=2715164 RepID=A0A6G8RZA0_9GAMM|nr:alpha-ketoglutarate-dependent dioxygenase AlkB [Acinetobacter shaoyimingii]QIO07063.1 alpha-ketoglutarate-dependent dioxygenase AlkB [Acinetobacter shaoyimingii]